MESSDAQGQPGNFLFRMGIPDNVTNQFDYKSLVSWFNVASIVGLSRYDFPYQPYLIDICLLTSETADIQLEQTYFQQNPSQGMFVHWPTFGLNYTYIQQVCSTVGVPASQCPSEQPGNWTDTNKAKVAVFMFQTAPYKVDDLDNRLSITNKWLTTSDNAQGTVLFGHCECGCDRTGEFFASYYMKYFGWTFSKAMSYDVLTILRNPSYGNQVATQWYCEYLRAIGEYAADDCGNCQPFACSDSCNDPLSRSLADRRAKD